MSLPSGYKRLKYIEATGTQYINTGKAPASNTVVNMKVEVVTSPSINACLFGSRSSSNAGRFTVFYLPSAKQWAFGFNGDLVQFPTSIPGKGTFDITVSMSDKSCTINGTKLTSSNGAFSTSQKACIFAENNTGTVSQFFPARLEDYERRDGGTLVQNFIPCETDLGEVGVWDDVENVFYGNSGTGEFAAGPYAGPTGNRTLLDAVDYEIKTGNAMVDDASYIVTKGKTMIDGVIYTINLTEKEPEVSAIVFYMLDRRYGSATYNQTLTLYADPGMTWDKWVSSEYNTLGVIVADDYVWDSTSKMNVVGWQNSNTRVKKTDAISENGPYQIYPIF